MSVCEVRYGDVEVGRAEPTDAPSGAPEGALFVALDAPPPYGTILELRPEGDVHGRVVKVVAVVEGPHGGERRGVVVVAAEGEEVERGTALTRPDLAPLPAAGTDDAMQPPPSDGPAQGSASGPDVPEGTAVPAPVLEPEPSEVIDASAGAGDQGETETSASADPRETEDRTGSGSTKRRKARKRS